MKNSILKKFLEKSILKNILFCGILVCTFCFIVALIINIFIISYSQKYIFNNIDDIQNSQCAMILGAKVYSSGAISYVVRDRTESALELFKNDKVAKILISGDHGKKNYDEVNTIKNYIKMMHHIEDKDLFMDHAGFSTYESMYRARDIFLISDMVIVTQRFHLPRSIYIARKLGIDAVGYIAKEVYPYTTKTKISWYIREFFACVKSFFLVAFNAQPTYLGDTIPITEDGRASWD